MPGAARWKAAWLLACALAGLAPAAHAEKADRFKPLNVEADVGRYDDAKQFGVFTGNVVLSKGTMVIRAAQIEVRQTPDGYQTGVALGTPDQPATFRQKREGLDETIEGEGERIEYDARTDTVRLVGHAVVRRLRNGTVADETAGQVIAYNNTAEVFTVTGGPGAASPGNPKGRVRTVITPREGTPAAAEAASQPPPGAAPPVAPLQPSPALGGRR